jgi:diketogulonate reductase-like aldo/keto reductase
MLTNLAYKNELDLGVAIKEANLSRDKIFVTTKVLKNVDDITGALKTSLKKLQLDYVDLYLIHSPFFADEGKDSARLQAAWAEVEQLKEAGLAKSIGVSNFLIPHLEAILKTAKIKPAVNQIEWHPYLQRHPLIDFHKKNGIVTEAYGPLTAVSKAAPGPVDDILESLAKKYGVSTSEISLRFGIDQGIVVVTTSGKEQRLSDYLRVTKFKLTPAEIEQISKAGDGKHFRGFFARNFAKDDRS